MDTNYVAAILAAAAIQRPDLELNLETAQKIAMFYRLTASALFESQPERRASKAQELKGA